MIQITIGSNTQRKRMTIDPNMTLRQALTEAEIDYSVGTIHMDGCSLTPGQLDKSFTEMGVTDTCFLICVIKQDNSR